MGVVYHNGDINMPGGKFRQSPLSTVSSVGLGNVVKDLQG